MASYRHSKIKRSSPCHRTIVEVSIPAGFGKSISTSRVQVPDCRAAAVGVTLSKSASPCGKVGCWICGTTIAWHRRPCSAPKLDSTRAIRYPNRAVAVRTTTSAGPSRSRERLSSKPVAWEPVLSARWRIADRGAHRCALSLSLSRTARCGRGGLRHRYGPKKLRFASALTLAETRSRDRGGTRPAFDDAQRADGRRRHCCTLEFARGAVRPLARTGACGGLHGGRASRYRVRRRQDFSSPPGTESSYSTGRHRLLSTSRSQVAGDASDSDCPASAARRFGSVLSSHHLKLCRAERCAIGEEDRRLRQ
jgi:hypothetical protein